jgi:hypothetical protein
MVRQFEHAGSSVGVHPLYSKAFAQERVWGAREQKIGLNWSISVSRPITGKAVFG